MSDSPPNPHRRVPGAHAANDDLDAFEPPEFEPAQPRPRFDGWTAERQVTFIQALAESGLVGEAIPARFAQRRASSPRRSCAWSGARMWGLDKGGGRAVNFMNFRAATPVPVIPANAGTWSALRCNNC